MTKSSEQQSMQTNKVPSGQEVPTDSTMPSEQTTPLEQATPLGQAATFSNQSESLGDMLPKDFSFNELNRAQKHARAFMIISWTRILAAIPAIGLLVISAALVLVTTFDVLHTTTKALTEGLPLIDLAVEYVEFTDIYLLSIALFIMSLGVFSLFITDKIPMPEWLDFHDFDDLKERLVSVIIVMLGVYFLGEVLKGAHGIDLLWLGLAICAIVLALTLFARFVMKKPYK